MYFIEEEAEELPVEELPVEGLVRIGSGITPQKLFYILYVIYLLKKLTSE